MASSTSPGVARPWIARTQHQGDGADIADGEEERPRGLQPHDLPVPALAVAQSGPRTRRGAS